MNEKKVTFFPRVPQSMWGYESLVFDTELTDDQVLKNTQMIMFHQHDVLPTYHQHNDIWVFRDMIGFDPFDEPSAFIPSFECVVVAQNGDHASALEHGLSEVLRNREERE